MRICLPNYGTPFSRLPIYISSQYWRVLAEMPSNAKKGGGTSTAKKSASKGGGTAGKSTGKDLARRIESVLTRLAKECLLEEPDDVERFCYDFLSSQIGSTSNGNGNSAPPASSKKGRPKSTHQGGGVPSEDEESLAGDAVNAKLDMEKGRPGKTERVAKYKSTDSEDSQHEPAEEVSVARVKSMKYDEGEGPPATASSNDSEEGMFSMIGMSPEKLKSEVNKYCVDSRMLRLYTVWDGDNSGAIDLAELVVELHKFDEVARDSKAIQVASEALVRCDNSNDGELDVKDFSKLIVLFCHNIFKSDFNSVAIHLLAVAESTSEEAARAAADGQDVSAIMEADQEEREFLKETVEGIADSINDNIRKLKGNKQKFDQ